MMDVSKKHTFVPHEGPLNAKIALVGEQPGKQEVRSRRPFVGPAGRQLDECLQSAGISRFECYLTNCIKDLDKPLASYIDLKNPNRPIVTSEGLDYINLLKEELEKCSANVIVPIGNPALYALCSRVGITKWRGSVLGSTLLSSDRKTVPTLHPATILPPKNQFLNRHLIVFDLKKAKKESEFKEIRSKNRKIKISPSYFEAAAFLTSCYMIGKNGHTIDYDIEIYNEEVSCISFALEANDVMCIPFVGPQGDYFTIDQEAEVWKLIARILEDENIKKRGQNIAFDSHFLLRKYGIRAHNLDDTMVAQKILFPDYPVGLHFITTMYTDLPYYKDDGKKWFKIGGAWESLWRYNSLDSLSCAEAFPKQALDLERQGNLATYERQRKLIPPLVYMMERGIRVDVEGMKKEAEHCEQEIFRLREELNKLVGRDINPNSPQQLAQYFYVEQGHPPYRKRGGGITTDNDALKRLARKGALGAVIVRDIRSLVKNQGNYLNVGKVDKDSRIRCSYNPVGTRFSRISSSENIFGTGMNLQNWPHPLLKYLLADEGYVYYSLDMSQIESRIAAYVGNIRPMIEAFENGMDLHCLTGGLIFGKPYDEVSDKPGSSPLANGRFSERFWGKKSNYGFIYDQGYEAWSLQMDVPETEGKWIHGRYHNAYPEVKQKYHPMIKAQLGKDRTLTNLFDRKTLFLDSWDDKLFRAGYSCIPQGTTGDKINEHGINFIYYNQQWFKPVELLTQIHDSIGFQVPLPGDYWWKSDGTSGRIEKAMKRNNPPDGARVWNPERAVSWQDHAEILLRIKNSLETPLVWKEREFVVPVDLVMGLDMFKEGDKCREIKHKNFPTSVEGLARKLEENYESIKGHSK